MDQRTLAFIEQMKAKAEQDLAHAQSSVNPLEIGYQMGIIDACKKISFSLRYDYDKDQQRVRHWRDRIFAH